jgi:hypothetical protein
MEKFKKLLPLIIGGIVAIIVLILSKKLKNSNQVSNERSQILEKAREAKLAKSILRNSNDEESTPNIE